MGPVNERKPVYTVRQLAELAGVSVRTLHHYDAIGLLQPSSRSAAGYRLYEQDDLLRLQQILFFRELDFPLEDIRRILDHPGFDRVQALESHRRMLQERSARLAVLMRTIDKTIERLKEETMTLTDAELYEGFSEEQIERWQREVREQYDPKVVAESDRRVRQMGKEQWAALRAEGQEIHLLLANLMGSDPDDPVVQAAIGRHFAMMGQFYTVTPQIYRGLGQLYVEHPEFRAFYEALAPGLADFMQAAMNAYCDRTLAA
jgi:DNA-binding transcriptional MerR regulator